MYVHRVGRIIREKTGKSYLGSGNFFKINVAVETSPCLKKNLNASRPSEHPPVRGEKKVKTFRWNHRLQRPNIFMAINWAPRR